MGIAITRIDIYMNFINCIYKNFPVVVLSYPKKQDTICSKYHTQQKTKRNISYNCTIVKSAWRF